MKSAIEQQRKRKIQQLIRDVRKKFLTFKLGKNEDDRSISQLFDPITKRLDRIEYKQTDGLLKTVKLHTAPVQLKTAQLTDPTQLQTDKLSALKQHQTAGLSDSSYFSKEDFFPENTEEESQETQYENVYQSSVDEYLKQYPVESRHYISSILSSPEQDNVVDITYGPKYDSKISKWFLGNKAISFDGKTSEIIIDNNERFPGTPGLYRLIFDKQPTDYTKEDSQCYKTVLNLTNVHRRQFDATKQRRGSAAFKWVEIIKPLTSTQGGSLLTYNEKPIEYVYWNDVNELVDRLQLLHASRDAGNTSVDNEIQSIIEELREANIIY